jgi:hypothetical protein
MPKKKNEAARALNRMRNKKLTEEERVAIATKASAAATEARMKLGPKERSERARRAAEARWNKAE